MKLVATFDAINLKPGDIDINNPSFNIKGIIVFNERNVSKAGTDLTYAPHSDDESSNNEPASKKLKLDLDTSRTGGSANNNEELRISSPPIKSFGSCRICKIDIPENSIVQHIRSLRHIKLMLAVDRVSLFHRKSEEKNCSGGCENIIVQMENDGPVQDRVAY